MKVDALPSLDIKGLKMLEYLVYAIPGAVVLGYATVRDLLAAHRSEVRHREGRDRFNRAIRNAEKLGFVESDSNYGDFNDITDISLRLKADEGVWIYIQQQGDKVRSTLHYFDRQHNHPETAAFNAVSYSDFVQTLQVIATKA